MITPPVPMPGAAAPHVVRRAGSRLWAGVVLCLLAVPHPGVARGDERACAAIGAPSTARVEHLAAVNALRGHAGLSPVSADDRLDRAAQGHACRIARTGRLDHVGPGGSTIGSRTRKAGYRFCTVLENLAAGQASAVEAVRHWAGSPGHLGNIRDAAAEDVGFGAAEDASGRRIWVQILATPCR